MPLTGLRGLVRQASDAYARLLSALLAISVLAWRWTPPAPQLPSLEVFPLDCTVEEFAEKVSSQHVIVCYGDHRQAVRDFCKLVDIDLI